MNIESKKSTKLGGRIWVCLVLFGLIGQIAWIVENMYFAKFAQDIFIENNNVAYLATTLMVILSAIAATVTTIFSGAWSDRIAKRKPFIAYGYIAWGITIALFALIPLTNVSKKVALIVSLLVIFDCVMTFAGSTANDAAFSAWVADNTDKTNRGLANSVLSIFPLIAVVIVMVGLGWIYDANPKTFFLILGGIPLITGLLAIFLLKDSPNVIQREETSKSLKDVFYGFRPSVVKENKMMYVALAFVALIGIAQQTFFSYLINFLISTLGLGEAGYIIPMAVIIVGAALVTGVCGVLYDKIGRKKFYIPLLVITVIGILSFYFLKFFMNGTNADGMATLTTPGLIIMYVAGVLMMGGILSLTAALNATFQDYIPKGKEGSFQGVRMTFTVLIPMIVGPIISLIIGYDAMGIGNFQLKFEMFIAASIVAMLAIVPAIFVRKDADKLSGKEK